MISGVASNEIHDSPDRGADEVARRWNLAAAAIAVLTGLGAVSLPLGTSSRSESTGVDRTTRVSLLSSEGTRVLIVVAIPVLLVVLPLTLRSTTARYRSRVVIVLRHRSDHLTWMMILPRAWPASLRSNACWTSLKGNTLSTIGRSAPLSINPANVVSMVPLGVM